MFFGLFYYFILPPERYYKSLYYPTFIVDFITKKRELVKHIFKHPTNEIEK